METLHIDFTQDATRRYLERVLMAQLEAQGIAFECRAEEQVPGWHHHNLGEILDTIGGLTRASDKVRQDMRAVYQVLAEAEATVHGCAVEETHFHEVGNAEAIACVLRISTAVELLGCPRITATPVQTGSGKVQCAHGLLDIPAPATAAILARGIPVSETKFEGELCTPTSAALIYHFVDEFIS